MKALLLAGALLMSGAAIAQTAPAPTPPEDPAATPPEDAVADEPMAPTASYPPPAAEPAPMPAPAPAAPPAPPPAAGQPQIVWQQPMVTPPPPPKDKYPVCSKTVKDSCRNPGGR